MDAWVLWILIAIVFAVGEVMTPSFYLAPFALGAGVAALADFAGATTVIALVVFLVSSLALLGFLRPIARRHLYLPAQLRSGAAALVGASGTVTERIANDPGSGAVKLGGEVWTARAYDEDAVIEVGTRVEVVEIKGATALVCET